MLCQIEAEKRCYVCHMESTNPDHTAAWCKHCLTKQPKKQIIKWYLFQMIFTLMRAPLCFKIPVRPTSSIQNNGQCAKQFLKYVFLYYYYIWLHDNRGCVIFIYFSELRRAQPNTVRPICQLSANYFNYLPFTHVVFPLDQRFTAVHV